MTAILSSNTATTVGIIGCGYFGGRICCATFPRTKRQNCGGFASELSHRRCVGTKARFDEPLRYVVAEFLDSIRTARRPLTDGETGLRVVRLLEAVQRCIKNGGGVEVLSPAARSLPAVQ